jgi:CheY-like chemotaxis protein
MSFDFSQTCALVVEDEKLVRMVIEEILSPIGARLTFVSNAQEALEHLAEQRPNLILSDAVMPGMDGFNLCRTVKENDAWRSIPFVLLTALHKEILARSQEVGAEDAMSKSDEEFLVRMRVRMLLRIGASSRGAGAVEGMSSEDQVLVISGSPSIRSILSVHLGQDGPKLLTAGNESEAFHHLADGNVDAILVDWELAHDHPADLLAAIRAIPGCLNVPIFALVAKGEEKQLEAMEGLIQGCLRKPLTAREDRHLVKLLLSYSRCLTEV